MQTPLGYGVRARAWNARHRTAIFGLEIDRWCAAALGVGEFEKMYCSVSEGRRNSCFGGADAG